jgi:predicted GNAT superfamily acetyltransferase
VTVDQASSIVLRELRSAEELAVMPPFERLVWGGGDDCVSVNMLVACLEEGGVAIGAFVGELVVGTVFGFRTFEPHVLHSHYLAVHPDYRRHGLGERLKRQQAHWCRQHGITAMRWTFDPLQLGNAHLNLNKLGAFGVTYHVNHYGTMGGINGGLPSDRLTVQWELVGERPSFSERREVVVPPVTPEQIAKGEPEGLNARLTLRDEMAPLMADGWRATAADPAVRTYTMAR